MHDFMKVRHELALKLNLCNVSNENLERRFLNQGIMIKVMTKSELGIEKKARKRKWRKGCSLLL